MYTRIISISRKFGSGGRSIGRKVADRLGIQCYDNEIIEEISAQSGFSADYIREAGEYAPGGLLTSAFSHRQYGPNNADMIWNIQYKIIRNLAEKGPCVIVGRCADHILGDKECLRVFIHAGILFRTQRIARQYGISVADPERMLVEMDRRRASYYWFSTGKEWGCVQNYDICLDSGTLGIDGCVDIITHLYENQRT